jgi:hypothetical protein
MATWQFSETHGPQNWNFSRGTGIAAPERERERPQVAVLALLTYLVLDPESESEFAAHLALVRRGERPLEVARAYGNGRRREVIASLLIAAVEGGDDPDRQLACAFRRAYWTPETVPGRGTYVYRGAFHKLVDLGARGIMRRGAHRCLLCGTRLAKDVVRGAAVTNRGRTIRRDYCGAHSGGSCAADRERVEHAINEVFRWVAEGQRAAALIPGD